jgi:hypothetical protein
MANIELIPTGYRQSGNVCLLASYSFILGYYKRLSNGRRATINIARFFETYLTYLQRRLSEVGITISPKDDLRGRNVIIRENYICDNIHLFCKTNGDIRGYEHIMNFHQYLAENQIPGYPINFEVASSNVYVGNCQEATDIIRQHLEEQEHNLSMVFYPIAPGKGHSVVVGINSADGQIFFRDPNCNEYSNVTYDNRNFSEELHMSEYILFRSVL